MPTVETVPSPSTSTLDLARHLVGQLEASRAFFERTTSVFEEKHAGFRPRDEMYSVAQQVAHAAATIDWFTEGAFSPEGFDLETGAEVHARWLADQTSLVAVRRLLREAFDRAIARFGSASWDELLASLPEGPVMSGKPRLAAVSGIEEHTAHHRGSLAVYARLLGLVPPMPYTPE